MRDIETRAVVKCISIPFKLCTTVENINKDKPAGFSRYAVQALEEKLVRDGVPYTPSKPEEITSVESGGEK